MKVVPLRLPPGADLRRALEVWMVEQQEQAGCVLSAVGSLSVAQLRKPEQPRPRRFTAGTSTLARWCAPPPSWRAVCCRTVGATGSWIRPRACKAFALTGYLVSWPATRL